MTFVNFSNMQAGTLSPTKGNIGHGQRRRRQRMFLWGVGLCCLLCAAAFRIYDKFSLYGLGLEEEMDDDGIISSRKSHRKKLRKEGKNERHKKRSTNLAQGEDAILQGHLTLVDIGIYGNALQGKDRYKVQGMFCQIDWSLQQENPSTVAMFKDLRAQSTHCDDTMVRVDLWEIVQKARQYDSSKNDVVPVAPNGVAFHETRCGSTLTANLLAGFSPTQSRVYSESPPPIMAMKACDESLCNSDLHVKLIQDVFYLMGRRPRGTGELYYQFYKIQSVGTMYIQKFTAAFPDTPWIFLYRDSVEVMQSHTKGVRAGDYNRLDAVCTRYYSKPVQFTTTEQVINNSRLTMRSISKVQYCAAHLAALSLSAIQEHERSGKGRFVNYSQLPDIMWEQILPKEFGVPVDANGIAHMQKVSGVYSKGRGYKANKEWTEDSTKKLSTAPQSVLQAAELVMRPVFGQMESLSTSSQA